MVNLSQGRQTVYERSLIILLIVVVLLAAFAVYGQLAGHEFVSLDDSLYVFDNPRVLSGLSRDNIIWAFRTMTAEFWHPLTWLSLMLDIEIFGVGPGGHLLTNLLLHLFNCALVFICFHKFTDRLWESWLIALLFALHPFHVEPVAWVSGRKELLYACFFLLTLLAYGEYVRSPGKWRYSAVVLFFAMGMMAKPMIVTLPFVLLLLDYWPFCRDRNHDSNARTGLIQTWRSLVTEKIPLFGISLAGIVVAVMAQQRGGGLISTETLPPSSRIAQVLTAYAVYLKKSIWPGDLTVFYPVPAISPGLLTSAIVLLATVTAVVICRARRERYLFTGWFWFLGMLVPVIGLVKVGEFFIADRYMYLPLTGILVMVVFSLKILMDKLSRRLIWMITIPVLLTGVYAPATFLQVQTWQDSETLYYHALNVSDDNFLAHCALGKYLARRNDKSGTIAHLRKAVEIRPDRAPIWVMLGKALGLDQQWGNAEAAFTRAAQLEPEHPAVWFYIGCARAARGKKSEAIEALMQSLERARQQTVFTMDAYSKVMDFYKKGVYYESRQEPSAADRFFTKALVLMDVNLPGPHITRLVLRGYDQWVAGLDDSTRGVD